MTAGRSALLPVFVLAGFLVLHVVAPSDRDATAAENKRTPATAYRSPGFLALAPDGKTLYVSDQTSRCIVVLDTVGKAKRAEIAVNGEPCGLCLSPDGKTLYVAERYAGTVAIIDTAGGTVTGRINVGRWPEAVALAPKTKRLYVGNQDSHTVSVIDLGRQPAKQIKQIPAVREPNSIAVTPDERFAVVTNRLPDGVSTDPTLSAVVSIIDTAKLVQTATVKLPPGSTLVNSVCTSPDGKWAYVVHGLGRFNLPITQLERGWVNTYALSIIDIAAGTRLVTVLLDDLTQGAANPFSVVCSKDGRQLWIAHAGTHEVSFIDIGRVHELLGGKVSEELASLRDGTRPNIWIRIKEDRQVAAELENDLTALYIAGAIRRASSGGNGPRSLVLSPDGKQLYVANYYSGQVSVLDAADGKLAGTISLGPQPEPDSTRRGEMIFHDATKAFQRWHSCSSCHPNQGRVDGLRWDFLRDGIGNPKDTISLPLLEKTAPFNRRATRKTVLECARSGLLSGHMLVPTEQEVKDVAAYLVSLRPQPSPHLSADGKLSEAAQRGKQLFETKADCARCHPGPVFTDKRMHNVGVLTPNEPDGRYDTPSLIEAYRTGPFLHDGRARTVKEVLTTHNKKDLHGKTTKLSAQEIDDLVAYVLSL